MIVEYSDNTHRTYFYNDLSELPMYIQTAFEDADTIVHANKCPEYWYYK